MTDPGEILKKAVEIARPLMGIQKCRVGSVMYNVPVPVTEHRSYFESRRWILNAARDRNRKESAMAPALAKVILETFNNTGRVISQRNEHHKTCEQNRAYAHFRTSQ